MGPVCFDGSQFNERKMGKSNFKSNFYIGKMGLGTKENAVRGKKGCRTLHDKIYSINVKIYSLKRIIEEEEVGMRSKT